MTVWGVSCVFPSSLGKLEDKVGAEGSGESQQVETGEYDHEACTFKM